MRNENPEEFDDNRRWQEIVKCANSFEYFCENYFEVYSQNPSPSVSDNTPDKVPFVLRDYQKECIDIIQKNQYSSFLKPRQMGLSAIFDAFAHWRAIFGYKENSAVIKFSPRLQATVYAKFPTWFPGYVSKREGCMGCYYPRSNSHVRYASERTPTQLAGYEFQWLFIDEADGNVNIDSLFETYGQILDRIKIVAYSSRYRNCWTNFKKPVPFVEHQLHYSQNPIYTIEFLDQCKKNLGPKAFRREVLCEPLATTEQMIREDFSAKTSCIMAGLGLDESCGKSSTSIL